MSHNLLDNLEVGFILTEPCAECMTKIMDCKIGRSSGCRRSSFAASVSSFIIVSGYALDCPVNTVWR